MCLVLGLEVEVLHLVLLEVGLETHAVVDLFDLHHDLVVQVLASYRWHLLGFTHVNLVRRVAEPQLLLVRQLRTLKHRTLVVDDARWTVHLQVLVLESRVLLAEHVFKGTTTDLR